MHATAILKMPSQALTSGRSGLISSTELVRDRQPTLFGIVNRPSSKLSSRPEPLIPEGDEKRSGGICCLVRATAILKMPSQTLANGRSGLISGSSTDPPQNCHPDRSLSSPKGMRSGVEGPVFMHATAILKMPSQTLANGRSGLISGSSTDPPQNCHPDRRSGVEGPCVHARHSNPENAKSGSD